MGQGAAWVSCAGCSGQEAARPFRRLESSPLGDMARHRAAFPFRARRAEELVKILMHAFDTESGIPYGQINLQTRQGKCAPGLQHVAAPCGHYWRARGSHAVLLVRSP